MSYLKFFVKVIVVGRLRSLLVSLAGAPVNRAGWERRILLINLQAMGDLVMFTSVLKHYRRRFPGAEITLLLKAGTGMDAYCERHFVSRVISVPYRRLAGDPWFGFMFVRRLRRIGFATVINYDFSAVDVVGRMAGLELGAENAIGYEGQRIDFEIPTGPQQSLALAYARKKIFPRYTKLIPALPEDIKKDGRVPSHVAHYIAMYEAATGFHEHDYATTLPLEDGERRHVEERLRKLGVPARYAVVNANGSWAHKRWPAERFGALMPFFAERKLSVVLIGGPSEEEFTEELRRCYVPTGLSVAGKTSFEDMIALVERAAIVLSNDTSTVHVAVALRRPLVALTGGWTFGTAVNYGYADINRWAWTRTPCYFDNWRCTQTVRSGQTSQCLAAVSVVKVEQALRGLWSYLEKHPQAPQSDFSAGFTP